jgi:hypothetical protein
MSNPSMPGLVKIGRTTRSVEQRANELWQTGVPTPFVVEFSILSPDCEGMELRAHEFFHESRVDGSREFFRVSPGVAFLQLQNDLYFQVESIVEEYIPGHSVVEDEMILDGSFPSILATHFNMHTFQMVDAYQYLTPEDMSPAVERMAKDLAGEEKMVFPRPLLKDAPETGGHTNGPH